MSKTIVALLALVQAVSLPTAYPRPGTTRLFENSRVIVWDIAWLKQQYPLHRHPYDLIGVYYTDGDRIIVSQDGVPTELAFAVPMADFLRDSGVRVWRISEASHYEIPGNHAASVETSLGYVSVLQFADGAAAQAAARDWFRWRPLVTSDARTLYLAESPRLDALVLKFVARRRG